MDTVVVAEPGKAHGLADALIAVYHSFLVLLDRCILLEFRDVPNMGQWPPSVAVAEHLLMFLLLEKLYLELRFQLSRLVDANKELLHVLVRA